jgi:type I restriction enzyme S subunit
MSDWKIYKLGDLIEKITKGTTPSTLGGGFVEHGINFIKSESVGYDGRIDKSTFAYITEETNEKLRRSQLQEGDILFSMAGIFLGKNAIVTKDILPANTNQALAIIRLRNEITSPNFVHYFLRQKDVIKKVNSMSGQSAQPNINFEEIKSIEINIPDKPTQTAIVQILSSLDNKIELNLQMNQTLEAMAQAIFKEWFVDFKFPGFDGELVDGLPKGWKVNELGDVTTLIAGGDKPKVFSELPNEINKIPIYSNGISDEGLYGYTNEPRIVEESVTVSARGTIGFVCLRLKPYLPIVRLISVIPKCESLSAKYLYFWLLNQNISGTGTTQQQLTVPDFRRFSILIPAPKLTNEFTTIVDAFYQKIDENKKQIQSLSQTRDTLLPKLMTGQLGMKN